MHKDRQMRKSAMDNKWISSRGLTLHDARRQQRCLAETAGQTSVKKVPLELLVNLIPGDLLLQPQRIGRVEFHAETKQNRVHVWNTVAVSGGWIFWRFCTDQCLRLRARGVLQRIVCPRRGNSAVPLARASWQQVRAKFCLSFFLCRDR